VAGLGFLLFPESHPCILEIKEKQAELLPATQNPSFVYPNNLRLTSMVREILDKLTIFIAVMYINLTGRLK